MVKVKLKTNKTRVYEAYSNNTVKQTMGIKLKTAEEKQRELQGLWGRLMKKKSIDIRKLYKGKTMADMGMAIPVAKMRVPVKVKITDAITGVQTEEEIVPAEIAQFCEMAKTQAASTRELGPILGRFNKPILWTFNIDTAASDGVRIAFNPIFAEQLLYKGKGQVKEMLAQGKRMSSNDRIITMARLVLYVICHEAYHQIYRHREQAERKTETQGGKNHQLANIAMDAEINRDLEKQIPKYFAGATAECDGIFDDRFRMEPWQLIFDAYFYNKVSTPNQPINQNPVNNQQQQGQQGQGSGSSQQQQGQGGQSGQQDGQQGQSGSQSQSGQQGQSEQSSQSGSQSDSGNQSGQSGQQQSDDGSQQGGSSNYDDTDLSAADPDTMSDYGMDQMPDNTNKSSEYQDAYNDEVKKELDKAMGKGSGNGDEDSDDNQNGNGSGDDQEGDNSENDSQTGNGNQSGEQGNERGNSQSGNSSSDNDGSSMNGDMSDQGSTGNSKSGRNSGQMSAEEKAAREQARKDVKKAIDDMKNKIDRDMQAGPNEDEVQKQLEGKEFDTTTSSTFGGADMLSQEQMAEIAKESGDPYTAEELTCDPKELSRKYNEEHMDQLRNISPDLANKLNDIADKLKNMQSLANWKQKLRKHFTAAMEAGTQMKRSKRTMSQSWRDDRFNPYKKVPFEENNAANIFYLIDNSGSMYGNGNGIFYQIFKEICTMEKTCKVLNSARAYFTTGRILPENVAMWNIKTPIKKRLELLGDRGGSGGTDIPGNTISVTKLKKPYYYDNGEKHTTIIVFTDGEDTGWEQLKLIPSKIRKDVVFVVFNQNVKFILKTFAEMQKLGGISLKNLIGIDTSKFGKRGI